MKKRKLGMIISSISMKISLATPEELGKYNVNILAGLYGLSAPNLCRAFQKRKSLKLGFYMRYLKFLAFEDLIRKDPYMPINAALKILDIRSGSHFAKLYKKYRHMTPYEMVLRCQLEQWKQRHTSV